MRRSGKAKVAPADEDDDTELATKKSIFDGDDGIRLTRAESFKILSKKNSFDDDDDNAIQVTRTKSLTVIVPSGQYVCTCHVLQDFGVRIFAKYSLYNYVLFLQYSRRSPTSENILEAQICLHKSFVLCSPKFLWIHEQS